MVAHLHRRVAILQQEDGDERRVNQQNGEHDERETRARRQRNARQRADEALLGRSREVGAALRSGGVLRSELRVVARHLAIVTDSRPAEASENTRHGLPLVSIPP